MRFIAERTAVYFSKNNSFRMAARLILGGEYYTLKLGQRARKFFNKIKKSIEAKRGSRKISWRAVVGIKDLAWILSNLIHFTNLIWHYPVIKRLLFKRILGTKAMECNNNSDTEIRSLVCHYDLFMYLVSIKSFLRFYNYISVIVHDDGSLTEEDKKILGQHIINVIIIERGYADSIVNSFLSSFELCKQFRDVYPISIQLFDYNILSKKNKIISLDSDILFLNNPQEVIAWIKNKSSELIYNEERALLHSEMFEKHKLKEAGNINAGFCCYYRDIIDYKLLEQVLERLIHDGFVYKTSQGYFNLLAKNSQYKLRPLDYKKYKVYHGLGLPENQVISGNEIMIHFIGLRRFYRLIYPRMARKVIKQLS